MRRLLQMAAASAFAVATVSAPLADAIGPPEPMNDVQRLIVGVWQEDGCANIGYGHTCVRRTLAIASTSLTILSFASSPEDIYSASTESSSWTLRDSTASDSYNLSVVLKNEQGETVGGEITVAPDQDGKGLYFTGMSAGRSPSHFTQIVGARRTP